MKKIFKSILQAMAILFVCLAGWFLISIANIADEEYSVNNNDTNRVAIIQPE